MPVDREIVMWTLGPTRDALEAGDLGAGVPVVFAGNEVDFLAYFPPHRLPLAYFVDLEAILGASVALLALLAARPTRFPPVILFGSDLEAMRRLMFDPNSQVIVRPEDVAASLAPAVRYWTEVNFPLS